MWNKVLKIGMAAAAAIMMVVVIPMGQAAAVGVDTVVKAVGGKAVVRSLAEEAGLMLAPKQLDNVVSVIEKKSFDGDPNAIDFLTKANQVIDMPSSEPASKTGFKKYVLDPVVWLTGLDLVFEAVDAFNDGYDNQTPIQVYDIQEKCGFTITDVQFPEYGTFTITSPKGDTVLYSPNYGDKANQQFVGFDVGFTAGWDDYSQGKYTLVLHNYNHAYAEGYDVIYKGDSAYDLVGICDEDVREVVPSSKVEVGEITNIKNHFDNDTYDNDTTYKMEIEMPDNVTTYNYDNDTTIWNMPDPELELEVAPDIDTGGGGDGTVDPPTTDPDNDDGRGDSIDVLVRVDDEIPIHEKFFLEMADMGQKVEDMYNGLVHFFDTAANGFEGLTDGMTGFTSFLDSFFDWLPDEYVTLLGSGFALGVVAFFIRR